MSQGESSSSLLEDKPISIRKVPLSASGREGKIEDITENRVSEEGVGLERYSFFEKRCESHTQKLRQRRERPAHRPEAHIC